MPIQLGPMEQADLNKVFWPIRVGIFTWRRKQNQLPKRRLFIFCLEMNEG
jgi:hypothetical protein